MVRLLVLAALEQGSADTVWARRWMRMGAVLVQGRDRDGPRGGITWISELMRWASS